MTGSPVLGCAFCKVIAGPAQANALLTSDDSIVFLDRNPNAPSQLPILPCRHVKTLLELEEAGYLDLMSTSNSLANPLSRAMGADQVAMAVEGYGVLHAHILLVPVNGPVDLDPHRQPPVTEADLAAVASALRAALAPP